MTYLKMVVFNLVKHPKRAMLILLAILVSVSIMELVGGMLEGIRQNFFTNMLADGGHGQVRGFGYSDQLDTWSNNIVINNYQNMQQRLQAAPELAWVEPLMLFRGLTTREGRTLAIRIVGATPGSRFFGKVRRSIADGSFLPNDQALLLSTSLAAYLKVIPGDKLRLMVEDHSGRPRLQTYTIETLFETDSKDFDDHTIVISLAAAQSILRLPNAATELRFVLQERDNADSFVARQHSWFEEQQAEILSWRDLNSGLLSIIDMMDVMILFFNLLVITVSATVITNAILMNVFERLPEYGTLQALGFKKRHLLIMILSEGCILGVAGSLAGLAVGIPIVLYFQNNGMDWGAISEAFGMGSFFNFFYTPGRSLVSGLAGCLTAVLGSLYAAYCVGKLDIVETLKSI